MDTRKTRIFPVVVLATVCSAAWSQEAEKPERARAPTERDYLLGAAVASSESTLGSEGRRLRLEPLWSFQLGRFRISSSRAAALWQLGREPYDPGVSTVLVRGDQLSLSTSLQYDRGRRASSDVLFQGLPDVRTTVRGRLTARYALGEHWSARAALAADLLGREGGVTLSPALSYRLPLSSQTQLDLSAGALWGSGTYLRTHYGIAPDVALAAGRTAYLPQSGWVSWQLGAEISTALSTRWVGFAGLGYTAMLGDARHSPLVSRRDSWGATVGVAYRCC